MSTKKLKFKTPTCTLGYSYITNPDPRYGGFKTTCIIPPGPGQDMIVAAVDSLIDAAGHGEGAHRPYKMTEDGDMELVAKTKLEKGPTLYDSLGHQMTTRPMVTRGSIVRVSGMFKAFDQGGNKGVTAYLNAVQLIKLGSAAQFDAVEDEDFDGDMFVEGDGSTDEQPFDSLVEAKVNEGSIGGAADF